MIVPLNDAPTNTMNFSDFIRNDVSSSKQRTKLYNLETQCTLLQSLGFQSTSNSTRRSSFYDYISTKEYNFIYKTVKLKNKIQDMSRDTKIKLGRLEWRDKCCRRLGWIFIQAVLDGKRSNHIISNLIEKGFDVDRHIFGIPLLPTYYYFAQVVSKEKLTFVGDVNYSWNGIPIGFFSADDFKGNPKSLMTLTQYILLAELKKIFNTIDENQNTEKMSYSEFRKNWKKDKETAVEIKKISRKEKVEYEKPVFLMDLFCMLNKHEPIKKFIKIYPDLALKSKICYLAQSDSKITMELLNHNVVPYQEFNKITSLHLAAKSGNLEMVAFFIEIGQDPNAKDEFGNTPLHYAMMNGNRECYLYMTKKKYTGHKRTDFVQGDVNEKNLDKKTPEDLYKENGTEVLGDIREIFKFTDSKREEYESARKFKVVRANLNQPFRKYFKDPPKVKNLENIRTEDERQISNINSYIWLTQKLELTEEEKAEILKQSKEINIKKSIAYQIIEL